MLIVGAKGFAKEILEVFYQSGQLSNIAFYDDLTENVDSLMYDIYPILKNQSEVINFFHKYDNNFTIGIGNPKLRHNLYLKFKALGGNYRSSVSPRALMGEFDINIGVGSNILANAIFSNSVTIGKGCIVYYNVIITHDCHVNDFVELSPNVILLGNVNVGSFTQIGANTTVLPKINIGKNVVIGAGSIVTKDIPDNSLAYGNPAKIIKKLDCLKF